MRYFHEAKGFFVTLAEDLSIHLVMDWGPRGSTASDPHYGQDPDAPLPPAEELQTDPTAADYTEYPDVTAEREAGKYYRGWTFSRTTGTGRCTEQFAILTAVAYNTRLLATRRTLASRNVSIKHHFLSLPFYDFQQSDRRELRKASRIESNAGSTASYIGIEAASRRRGQI
ncbi:hypothetical protein R3P38DRAFT_3449530 [Favolaschia claudopus]|uniref:Transposase DDE domain-containing protein n=1 Tax=Favolaschia claudopus TaxID=2862362 RepID=A0AAW0CW63_9AGAR